MDEKTLNKSLNNGSFSFSELLNMKKGVITAFTGGGGKSSFIFKLADELKEMGKVCITTSAKMSIPDRGQYERFIVENHQICSVETPNRKNSNTGCFKKIFYGEKRGVDFYSLSIDYKKNKILGSLDEIDFEHLKKEYDYILVEADGSRGKSMKYWKNDEPCIPAKADRVVGVFNIKILGKTLKNAVLRPEQFCTNYRSSLFPSEKSRLTLETTIDEDIAGEYLSTLRFFQINSLNSSRCQREYFIFINGVEGIEDFNSALALGNILKNSFKNSIETYNHTYFKKEFLFSEINPTILIGSIRKSEIYPHKSFQGVIMGSGNSRRFGSNKLLKIYRGKTLLEITCKRIGAINFFRKKLVISPQNLFGYGDMFSPDRLKSEFIGRERLLENLGENSEIIINEFSSLGQSHSIKLGIEDKIPPDAYIFFPCDQPFLMYETILILMKTYLNSRNCNIAVPWIDGSGNAPVIFSHNLREELMALKGDTGGREVIKRMYPAVVKVQFFNKREFMDIDFQEDLKHLK